MNRRTILTLTLAFALPTLAAGQDIKADELVTLNGVIETVDPSTREVLIRGESGGLLTVVAGRGVERLEQIRPGDRITVHYYQALAARVVRRRDGSAEPPFAGINVAREANRPGGEVTRVHAARVTIRAVNRETNAVTFTGPGNLTRTVIPRNPDVLEFVRSLREGEEVDMIYEEALAVSIDPMR